MVPGMCHECGKRAYEICSLCHRPYCADHAGPAGLCSECYGRRGGALFKD